MISKNNCKYKYISVKLFKEENKTITDGIIIDINIDNNKLHIYSKLTFSGKQIVTNPICFSFTDSQYEEAIRIDIRNAIEADPYASARDVMMKTGRSLATVTRYYMSLKRELDYMKRIR